MSSPTKVTTLRKLNGQMLGQWVDSTRRFNVFPDAYGLIADWADVDLDEVDYREDEQGEGFFIHGELVAILDVTFRKAESVQPAFAPPSPILLAAE